MNDKEYDELVARRRAQEATRQHAEIIAEQHQELIHVLTKISDALVLIADRIRS